MLLIAFLALQLGVNAQSTSIKQFSFMLGNWEMKTSKGKLSESWKQVGESLIGKSYRYNLAGDSTLMETVIIKKIAGNFFFCVTGAQEDKTKTIKFKLVSSAENQLIFENKAHDFPQRIVYENKGKDILFAWIAGPMNGKEAKSEFNYRRRE